MDLTPDQKRRLDHLLQVYTNLTDEEEDKSLLRRFVVHTIRAVYPVDQKGHAFIDNDRIPSIQYRELLFQGISSILSPDAQDWQVLRLTGCEEITDASLRKVYSWKSQASRHEFKIFPDAIHVFPEPLRDVYRRMHNTELSVKFYVQWKIMALPLISERSATPDTEDDDL